MTEPTATEPCPACGKFCKALGDDDKECMSIFEEFSNGKINQAQLEEKLLARHAPDKVIAALKAVANVEKKEPCPDCDEDIAVGLAGRICITMTGDEKKCAEIVEKFEKGILTSDGAINQIDQLVEGNSEAKEQIAEVREILDERRATRGEKPQE